MRGRKTETHEWTGDSSIWLMSFHIIMFILFVEAGLKPIGDARTQFRHCLSIFPMPVVAVVASGTVSKVDQN